MVVRRAQSSLASGVDRVFAAVAYGRTKRDRRRPTVESMGHPQRMRALEALHERHAASPFDAPGSVFFGEAGEDGPWLRTPVRTIGRRGDVVDVRWRSGYVPAAPEREVAERYLEEEANHFGHARLFLHRDRPRPGVILVHGYLGGRMSVEERAWPVSFLFDRLGLDLALVVLPFHGARRTGGRPLFPASDPRLTIEGFRQAVYDIVSLRKRLEARGAPAVGVMGMSLGGYTSALAATVDPGLAFAVPMIPLASIADFAREGGRLVGTEEEQREQHAAIERAHRPVSPFARPSKLSSERVRVIGAEADRITPIDHARRLADHFDVELHTFHGGHLLQIGRGDGFREVARMLRDLGYLDSSGAPR